jgi:transposase
VSIIDPFTGEVHAAQVFIGVLGGSSFTYAEASWSQSLECWLTSHVHMVEYFGSAAAYVPDNLKAGVTKPSFYDPDINPEYQEFAEHYRATVLPARVRKPRDKAKAEGAVLLVERWILAVLRKMKFYSLEELNTAIRRLLDKLNDRPFQKLTGSRRSVFLAEEKAALRPLPTQRYEFARRKKARVHIDYHIELDGHYYSVPYTLVRQEVEARLTITTVEVFFEGRRIASHPRSYLKGNYTTLLEHMPPSHRNVAEWTPERMQGWANKIGPETGRVIAAMLAVRTHPEQAFRACLGVLSLGKKHSKERLEAACRRANAAGCQNLRSLQSILQHGLDKLPLVAVPPPTGPRESHENVRGPEYYTEGDSQAC